MSIPFSVKIFNYLRLGILLDLAARLGNEEMTGVIKHFEPNIPWERKFLEMRSAIYKKTGDSMARQADNDLNDFLGYEPIRISDMIR